MHCTATKGADWQLHQCLLSLWATNMLSSAWHRRYELYRLQSSVGLELLGKTILGGGSVQYDIDIEAVFATQSRKGGDNHASFRVRLTYVQALKPLNITIMRILEAMLQPWWDEISLVQCSPCGRRPRLARVPRSDRHRRPQISTFKFTLPSTLSRRFPGV